MGGSCRWRVSGSVGDGLVLLEPRPLARGVVHFEDGVHQHGGAARAVGFGQHLGVLAQLDLDDVALLRTRILCVTQRRRRREEGQEEEEKKMVRTGAKCWCQEM